MRTLVTGHNGYIGSVLVPVLERAGHEVVGLDSDLFAACTFGAEVPEVQSLRADVRDVESEDLVGFDAVIHLAAVCNDPVGDLNPQATYDINHLASVRLAEKAGRPACRASCSPPRAASTARPATRCWTRAPGSHR